MNITKLENRIKGICFELIDVINEGERIMHIYNDIKYHLEEIQDIEEENILDIRIDYDEIADKALNTCIFNNEYIVKLLNSIDFLIEDLQEWADTCNNEKKLEIEEFYIEALNEVRGKINLNTISEYSDLENQFLDMSNCLTKIVI